MKTVLMIALSIATICGVAQKQNTIQIGPKGGVVKTVQNYNIEMLNSTSVIYIYIYDKSLNAVSNSGVISEIVFCYPQDECLNKSLNVLGKNGFSVSIANPRYDYCDVTLIIDGVPIKAKFINSSNIAENN